MLRKRIRNSVQVLAITPFYHLLIICNRNTEMDFSLPHLLYFLLVHLRTSPPCLFVIVGWLREIIVHFVIKAPYLCHSRAVKRNNCSICDKSTIFTRSLPFNMTIYITYGGISEINPHCRKFKISHFSL